MAPYQGCLETRPHRSCVADLGGALRTSRRRGTCRHPRRERSASTRPHVSSEWSKALAAIALAYPLTFASAFLNTAVAAAAATVLDEGRHLSLGQALAVPTRRARQVAVWALLAAGVGVVLEQIAGRLPVLANIAARLLGLAWSLASLFAIPILALEGCSAPECLRRSARLVKKRWGEGISGNVIVSAWLVLVFIPAGVLVGIGAGAGQNAPAVRDTFIALGPLAFLLSIGVSTVVRQTFAVALFRLAETGTAAGPFQVDDLESPFTQKAGRRSLGERGKSRPETSPPPTSPLPRWKIVLGVLMLVLVFVLSFGSPLLELLLLVPPAVGIYRRARGRGGHRAATATIAVGLAFFGVRFFLPAFALRTVEIRSAAMEPTIGAHERVLFDRTGLTSVGIGAIVAVHAPKDAHQRLCGPSPHTIAPGGAACAMSEPEYKRGYYIRRVVAGPGDVISISGGHVIRNGTREREPYARACDEPQCDFPKPITIPRGMWFVMADNRREADDSRFFGPVPRRWIIGRALMVTWPPSAVGGL